MKTCWFLTLAAIALVTSGCDFQQALTDASNLASGLQQNKALVETFVQDIKRQYTPDSPDYQKAEALYFKARGLTDDYLGQIELASTTQDRSILPDRSGEAARGATADFVTAATASLSPEDRGLPVLAAIAMLPPIHDIIARLTTKKKDAAHQLAGALRWRSWDSITPMRDAPTNKKNSRPTRKVSRSD